MIKEYLGLSKREKRSFLIVVIILFASILFRLWLDVREPDQINLSIEEQFEVNEFIASLKQIPDFDREDVNVLPVTRKYEYASFNPNTVQKEELKQMGVSDFVAENIMRYRMAGGIFRSKEDMRMIYGMDSSLFEKIEPFIILPQEILPEKMLGDDADQKESVPEVSELNSARQKDLMKIKGMEPGMAGRIIKYRELLGGYVAFDQLREVYGIPDSVRFQLENNFTIDTGKIRKISLRMTEFSVLLRHPYLEVDHVKEIWKLKEFYGISITPENIKENKILPDSILAKIFVYFMK